MVIQNQYTRAIAVLPNLEAIGQAVDQLVLSGFPLAQIFLIGKDTRFAHQRRLGYPEALPVKELLHEANLETVTGAVPSRRRGMLVGNFTGGVSGLLLGLGLLAVPGIGEFIMGTVLLYLLSTVGAGTLAGGALGMFVSQNITERLAKSYMAQIAQGNYLLVVSGSEAEIFRAEQILYVRGIRPQQWI